MMPMPTAYVSSTAERDTANMKRKIADPNMCWPVEWFLEDVPLENKEGTSLDKQVEAWYNETISVPGLFEKFVEAPKNLQPLELPAVEVAHRENVLVFADSLEICKGILEAAPEGRKGTVKMVENCSALVQDDVAQLINEQRSGWDLVIFGYGMDAPEKNNSSGVIGQQQKTAKLYMMVLQEILRTEVTTTRIAVITRGVFTEDPAHHRRYGVQIVTGAHLFGMSNSARLEMEVRIQYIDTEWMVGAVDTSLAREGEEGKEEKKSGPPDYYKLYPRLASEIFRQQTFGHNSVRILKSGRYVLRRVPSAPYEAARRDWELPTGGTIVISGCGMLGLVMGQFLLDSAARARTNGFKLRYLSYTGQVSDENFSMWQQLKETAEELDILVDLEKCDISEPEQVDKFLDRMQGSLTGFIHTASVVRDSMLANLTWLKCDDVFKPKHYAALHLHSALDRPGRENPNLSFFWLFSHTSVYGNLGQINYSGTNSCLDALARHRAGRGRPAVSIQWGTWANPTEREPSWKTPTEKMDKRTRSEGLPTPQFSQKEAIRGFRTGLKTGLPVFSVLRYNPVTLKDSLIPSDTCLQCYDRNFQAEVTQVAKVPTLDRKHIYTVFRECQGSYQNQPDMKRLVYDAYTAGFIEEYENEWGDDFRKWKK
uniref:Type I polyketide synthase ketoyl reductase domain protein n=1 Tax=Gambierdiscus polynesiensis TaxID=439318 RepID=A0A1S6K865_9DINO|nr:type I polyketide synthase ketoyl reductase domain protein [Gambierdiscus polynesiensis]